MGWSPGLGPVFAGAHQAGQHQGRDPGADVHHGSASEVEILAQKAAAPDHVSERRINQQQPDRAEQAPEAEAQALHQRPGDQGGGDDREHALEQGKRESGNGESAPSGREIVQQRVLKRVADHGIEGATIGKGEAEADAGPDQRGDPHHHQAHAHGVEDVAPLNKTAVEKGQPGRHQKHQRRAHQNQGVVGSGTGVTRMGGQRCAEKQLEGWDAQGGNAQASETRPQSRFGSSCYKSKPPTP